VVIVERLAKALKVEPSALLAVEGARIQPLTGIS
jgi:hypothetical protein